MQSKSYCLLPIYGRKGIVGWSLLDPPDYEYAAQFRWCLASGYASRRQQVDGRQLHMLLHRELLGLKHGDPLCCDHINRNRLDNRRANIRVVTRAQNNQNHPSWGSSRFRGVAWWPDRERWLANVKVNGRYVLRRTFATELEAAIAAERARQEHFDFAEPDPELMKVLADA